MPNITLNMAGIKNLDQEAMKQNCLYNCGAYAVIAAVGAHNVFPKKVPLGVATAPRLGEI